MLAPEKRQREIKIRLTESEHQKLIDRSTRPELAAWIREICLAEKPSARAEIIKTDPALLRQLAGIGNNLNQIARTMNQQARANTAIDRISIIAALSGIELELKRLADDRQNP